MKVNRGDSVRIRSIQAWSGKEYYITGIVEVPPRRLRSGAVCCRVKATGTVKDVRKNLEMKIKDKSLWIPFSPSYISLEIKAPFTL